MRKFQIIFLLFICACSSAKHSNVEIEDAMSHYNNLILNLDADSISKLFIEKGNLGDIAIGRDSIKAFLLSFKNIKVLSQTSITKSITISKDIAFQEGSYSQTDLIGGKDTVSVKGIFSCIWEWNKKDGWLIRKMTTKTEK